MLIMNLLPIRIAIVVLALLSFSLNAKESSTKLASEKSIIARPTNWAQVAKVEGADNFHEVTPMLFRSAQPTQIGLKNIEARGIKTVINLRNFHSDPSKGTRLLNPKLNINTWDIQDGQVIELLRILRKPENGPFLIHCWHGADRTGLMVAMYRIVEQGWSKKDALYEMKNGGYNYHSLWRNIPKYIERVDVEKIRKAVVAP